MKFCLACKLNPITTITTSPEWPQVIISEAIEWWWQGCYYTCTSMANGRLCAEPFSTEK